MSNMILPYTTSSFNTNGLHKFLPCQAVGIYARQQGFIKREGNLNPNKFVQALCSTVGQEENLTLQSIVTGYNTICPRFEQLHYENMHDRIKSDGCVNFMTKNVMALQSKILKYCARADYEQLVERMNNAGVVIEDIYIHDGSYWHVHEELSDLFPGTRSARLQEAMDNTYNENGEISHRDEGNAQIGLQSTYSLKYGCMVNMEITAATANERNAVIATVKAKVLHIFDSGYRDFDLFRQIDEAGGYLLGKLQSNAAGEIVSCKIGKEALSEQFAGKKLSDPMLRDYRKHEDMDLIVNFNGHEYRVIRIYSKKDQKVQYLITNIMLLTFKASMIKALYRLRWQIELSFKHLKSGSNLRGICTRNTNIIYVLLLSSIMVDLLKILVTSVMTTIFKIKASVYRISIHTKSWFPEFLKLLMNGGSDGVLRLLKRLSKAKGIFEKARQAKSK